MSSVYLDHSASTPMLPAVWEAMRPFFADTAGNPASSHQAGRRARQALESARELTATHLGADPSEVIFTSGATEANNFALFGLAGQPPAQLLASLIEHPCVTEPLLQLRERGFELAYLPVDAEGVASGEWRVMRGEWRVASGVRVVAIMLANHETGAVQPVRELAHQFKGMASLHCDAAAAAGKISIDFHFLGAATLTISAHKFHGPKGIGALLVRRDVKLKPLLHGGHQQHGRRPGTEPVPLAVGLATALDLAMREQIERWTRVSALRRLFLDHLQSHAAPVAVNGPVVTGSEPGMALPHTLNVSFPGCQADVLLMNLDLVGVCCSTGSACSSGSLLPSPVLQAMGVPPERLSSAMRFSFSHLLTEAEIIEASQKVTSVVKRLRE